MGDRNVTEHRRAVVAIGVLTAGVVVGVMATASGDERPVTTTVAEPEIVMPAPQVDFEDLAAESPVVSASADATASRDDRAAATSPNTLRLHGAMTIEVEFSSLDADRQATYTLSGTFFGDMTGEWTEEGTEQYDDPDATGRVRSVGSGTASGELTVPGVGTGRVTSTNQWHSDNEGSVIGVSTITSGSGDLDGVTGTMRWNSTDDAGTITYQLDLTVPGR